MQYVIRPGDTLYELALRFGLSLDTLVQANPQIGNPNLIYPGQVIHIPTVTDTLSYHIVRPGDSLYRISRAYDLSLDDIITANPQFSNPALISPGQVVLLPFGEGELSGCVALAEASTGGSESLAWISPSSGVRQDLLTTPFGDLNYPQVEWSPNGEYIAYNAQGLWIVDSCGNNPRRLVEGDVDHFSWSNGGSEIAYSIDFSTYIVDIEGNQSEVSDNLYWPDWLPGDEQLVGIATLIPPPNTLATINTDGTGRKELGIPANASVAVSPAGNRVVFTRAITRPSSRVSVIFVYNLDTGKLSSVSERPIESDDAYYSLAQEPVWSPNGEFILYKTLISPPTTPTALSYTLSLATKDGQFIRDLDQVQEDSELAWGPDSDWIAYSRRSSIVLRRISTGAAKQLLFSGSVATLDWSDHDCPTCGE